MIVFLTLIYCALLALFVKLGVIKLNLFWKLSPVFWMLFLLVVLFVPMQWGAPAGQVLLIQKTVEIFPNVGGEVIEVQAESLVPNKKGDVLFRIEPVPFQEEVNRLTAALASAEQNVPQLKAALDAAAGSHRARSGRACQPVSRRPLRPGPSRIEPRLPTTRRSLLWHRSARARFPMRKPRRRRCHDPTTTSNRRLRAPSRGTRSALDQLWRN